MASTAAGSKPCTSHTLAIIVSEGRNFVSMGIRPELLRSVRYYCQILVEDVRTHEALLQVRTHTVPRENDQTNVVWNDSIYLQLPPGMKKKDVELKAMCFEHSPLSDHFQGEVVLPLGHLRPHRVLDQWYALSRRDKRPVYGEIRLQLELDANIPENHMQTTSEGTDLTVYRVLTAPSGLENTSAKIEDKRSPERVLKKSIRGFRAKIKKTTMGVRDYFGEANEEAQDDQLDADGILTDDEQRLHEMRKGTNLELRRNRAKSLSITDWKSDLTESAKDPGMRRKLSQPVRTGGLGQQDTPNENADPMLATLPKKVSSGHVVTDESGKMLGVVSKATTVEHLGQNSSSEEDSTTDEENPQQDAFTLSDSEEMNENTTQISRSQLLSTSDRLTFGRKGKEKVVVVADDKEEQEAIDYGKVAPLAFKRTIKVVPAATNKPPMVNDLSLYEFKKKSSGDGYSSGGSSKSRRRVKDAYNNSQRLALMLRYPNFDTPAKRTMINQRQRAYHAWLDAYHGEVDDIFDDTRDWLVPIEMRDNDKITYEAVRKEWKRPWRKEMKRSNKTKDHLIAVVNDEMEGMDVIFQKISDRARSHFEQSLLFPQAAVAAIQDLQREGRKRKRQLTKINAERYSSSARSPASTPPSPAQQQQLGSLPTTASTNADTAGHSPFIIVLIVALLLYILNRYL